MEREVVWLSEKKCRSCGCTWDNACITEYGPCWWLEEDLCSACSEQLNGDVVEVIE